MWRARIARRNLRRAVRQGTLAVTIPPVLIPEPELKRVSVHPINGPEHRIINNYGWGYKQEEPQPRIWYPFPE